MIFEEALLFEQTHKDACGVDFEKIKIQNNRTGQPIRNEVGLPSVSEPQVVRHYTRLSQQNFAIDTNMYPLGSCTMKHNPRLNEKLARLDGFANIHPMQPESTVQGALELMFELEHWLKTLTGLTAVSLNPAAGAHGELTGMMMIHHAHVANGNPRKVVLVPDSAHGTNPATAAMCGYSTVNIASTKNGLVDMDAFETAVAEHGENIAAFMLTNPNTCGLFEPNVKKIADRLHDIGAYFYCDGANFNAVMGKIYLSDIGVDVMQFNLHKTFSTPHGGGGPGCGPIAVSAALEPFLPTPRISITQDGKYVQGGGAENTNKTIGRIKGFNGQFGMMVRALAYMKSHGSDGLRQASEDAVLNANYILNGLKDTFNVPYEGPCMHECLLNDKLQRDGGNTTIDFAKGLLDKGFHPMTMYFPLVVQNAMLIEPTESETKETLDEFITAMKELAVMPHAELSEAPVKQFRRRLDETTAARKPVLTYKESIS